MGIYIVEQLGTKVANTMMRLGDDERGDKNEMGDGRRQHRMKI